MIAQTLLNISVPEIVSIILSLCLNEDIEVESPWIAYPLLVLIIVVALFLAFVGIMIYREKRD